MMWKRSRIRLGMNSKEVLENDVIGNFVCTIFKLTHHPKLAEHLVGGRAGTRGGGPGASGARQCPGESIRWMRGKKTQG
jgi:hypothetical protein